MQARAVLRNTKGSARKARLVADLIRGKDVYQAMNILRYSRKAQAPKMEKLLGSAINSWATKNEGLKPEDSELYVKKITVDGGPVLKRYRPAPFGRAHRIRKRMSHITIIIDSLVALDEPDELVEELEETLVEEPIEQVDETVEASDEVEVVEDVEETEETEEEPENKKEDQ